MTMICWFVFVLECIAGVSVKHALQGEMVAKLEKMQKLWTNRCTYAYYECVLNNQILIRDGVNDPMPMLEPNQLKVVSYNILGPNHGESSKHEYAPMSIRKWTRRRDKLMAELKYINADIFCLQEVSKKSLKETFIPGLLRLCLQVTLLG